MNTEKASYVRQNNMISDENIFTSKLCATANEHAPKGLNDKQMDKNRKDANDDIWIQPKNCIPITCFSKKAQTKLSLRITIINITCWYMTIRMTMKKKMKLRSAREN